MHIIVSSSGLIDFDHIIHLRQKEVSSEVLICEVKRDPKLKTNHSMWNVKDTSFVLLACLVQGILPYIVF